MLFRSEVILEIAENETFGTIYDFKPEPNLDENTFVTYVPIAISAVGLLIGPDSYVTEEDRSDGVCLPATGKLQGSFNGDIGNFPESKLYWQSRKLKGDGSFENWITMVPSFLDNEEWYDHGYQGIISNVEPGVFQFRVVWVFSNGNQIEFPYVRRRDSRSIKNGDQIPLANELLKAGALDFFGVAENEISFKLWKKAKSFLGSTRYSFDQEVETQFDNLLSPSLKNSNKCNIFVTHVARSVGATTPYFYLWGLSPHAPIARDDWYSNPGEHIALESYGWKYGVNDTDVAPGRVIAAYGTGHSSGHVCILDYDGSWIGAGLKTVNKFINLQNMDAHYRPFTIRKR